MSDKTPRWGRLAGESEEAHAAFLAYRDMAEGRSIGAVGQRLGKSRAILERWSSRHGWAERCRAWDNHLQARRDEVAAAEARKWEERRQAALEANWQAAQALRAKLEKMLAFPLQRTRTSKDGKTIIVEPARWTLQTAVTIARTAAEIEAAVLLAVGQDVGELTEAEVRATAETAGDNNPAAPHA